jgi:hypothetical protein
METITFDGKNWSTSKVEKGKASCNGSLSMIIGRLIVEFGLVLDEEHPLVFNADHGGWSFSEEEKTC